VTALAARLRDTWSEQARGGFLLSDPATTSVDIRHIADPISGVEFRLRWLPHREIRANVAELERRGILSRDRDEGRLFGDPRDPSGRYCFLCADNIREANPLETLIPMTLAGRDYFAGANFAWIADHHFTVMSAEHVDQDLTRTSLEAMLELQQLTGGEFRVLYNGAEAGATIPWHLHYQITSESLPVESLAVGRERDYPAAMQRFEGESAVDEADFAVKDWKTRDPYNNRVNVLVAGAKAAPIIHVFRRDVRLSRAPAKGLIGGFEMCGDLVYSEPDKRRVFEEASAPMVREVLEAVRPGATGS
jgi:hypothetical protein